MEVKTSPTPEENVMVSKEYLQQIMAQRSQLQTDLAKMQEAFEAMLQEVERLRTKESKESTEESKESKVSTEEAKEAPMEATPEDQAKEISMEEAPEEKAEGAPMREAPTEVKVEQEVKYAENVSLVSSEEVAEHSKMDGECLGINCAVLQEDLWVIMKRLGEEANPLLGHLHGIDPDRDCTWLAYGFNPTLFQFTGGWSGNTYVYTAPYNFADTRADAGPLLHVVDSLNINDTRISTVN